MTQTIKTLDELEWAMENDFPMVQYYLDKVTIDEHLRIYLQYLHDEQITTEVETHLNRYQSRSTGIHPSSASKKKGCLLKLYYECTTDIKPQNLHDQKMQLTWDIGTLLHDTFQTHLRAMYDDQFEAEVPLVDHDLHIKSRTDGIFSFDNYRFILEMKSIKEGGNFGWETVQAKPMEDNVRQAHFYMKLADVPFALIFYLNKNAGEWKEHAVVFNQNIWDSIMDDVVTPVTQAAYRNGEMVKANPGWHCRWCAFAHSCPEKKGSKDAYINW